MKRDVSTQNVAREALTKSESRDLQKRVNGVRGAARLKRLLPLIYDPNLLKSCSQEKVSQTFAESLVLQSLT